MKILILSLYNNPEQIIGALKIYQQNRENDIYFINCSKSLKSCDINHDNDFKKCFDCIIDKFYLFNLFNIPNEKIIDIYTENSLDIDLENIEEIKNFEYDNINFGSYIYDLYISLNLNTEYSKKLLKESLNIYNSVSKILDEIKPDKLYIYKKDNSIYNPIIKLSINKNIETILFEANDSFLEFYDAKNLEKINSNIFLEKINNEYLINGQKINKTVYSITKNEILKMIERNDSNSFIEYVKKIRFLEKIQEAKLWNNYETFFINNKIKEIRNKLDYKYKEASDNVKISACIIVKNEEKNIERCLNSIKNITDEIIILDTGSADKTIDLVKKYNTKVFNYEWIDDFSDARNKSISYAKNDWILIIDADEELTENTRKNILINIYDNPIFNNKMTFWFKVFHIYPNEQESTFHFRASLFNKKYGFKFKGRIHEYLFDPENNSSIEKKHCQEFIINHYCDYKLNENKFDYYIKILENELNNEKTINGKIFKLIQTSNEYNKIGNNNKSLEILLEAYNLFQEYEEYKDKLKETYIYNLVEISYQLVFNYSDFQNAKKYIDEVFQIDKDYNFPDGLYLKALIEEYYTKNYNESINIYNRLINSFRNNDFDKEETYELNSKGRILYPFCVIELYKIYLLFRKEDLALNTLINNENDYISINMFIIKHFILRNDLKNSANAYLKNNFINKERKDNLYFLLNKKEYKQAIYQIIDELLNSKNVFSNEDKKELIIKKNNIYL